LLIVATGLLVEIIERILFLDNFLLKLFLITLLFINIGIVFIKGRFEFIILDLILLMINMLLKLIHCLGLFKVGKTTVMPHHD
jgi:hypothetical protein